MPSFESLFKKFLNDVIKEAAEEKKKEPASAPKPAASEPAPKQEYRPSADALAHQYEPDEDGHYEIFGISTKTHDVWVAYFKDIFAKYFPEYTLETELSASVLDPTAHPKCKPVSFMLSSGGQYKLAVQLVTTKTYRGLPNKATEKICSDRGIKVLRFYEQCENREDYVADRIKSAL